MLAKLIGFNTYQLIFRGMSFDAMDILAVRAKILLLVIDITHVDVRFVDK